MLGIGFWAASASGGGAGAGAMELISTTILSSTASTVSLTSIPQTFKHLQIRAAVRLSGGSQIWLRFNGSSSAIYTQHELYANGSSVASYFMGTGQTEIGLGNIANSGDTAGIFTPAIIDVLDYASAAKNKTIRATNGVKGTGTATFSLSSGAYLATTAISSVQLVAPTAQSWQVGSRFSLYGISG